MDEQLFEECVSRLDQLGNGLVDLFDGLDNEKDVDLTVIKESLAFIYSKVNKL